MKAIAEICEPAPQPTAAPRLGRLPSSTTASANGVRRQRFRVLDFKNASGTLSYRVQGMTREKVYVRENYANEREAQCRRTQLENEYLLGDDTPLRQPRMTMLTEDQLHLAEQIFRTMHKAEMPDCDLTTAVASWLKAGRQKDAGIAPRLDEAFTQYETWLDSTPTLRPRTKENYRTRTRIFVNAVENYRLDAITPELIESYLAKRDVGPVARDSDRRVIKAFFHWASERPRRWLSINPAAGITVELGESPEPAVLPIPQCKALLRAAERHQRGKLVPYIVACLFGGLRPSEANRLTWDKVNLADKEIRLSGTDTKTGRTRIIPIGPTLEAWLRAYKGHAFYHPAGWRDMKAIKSAAGITAWQPDILRHTSISHYFRQSGSYGQTAEFHGNSESIIKAHYQGRVSSDETKAFYNIKPSKKVNQ